MYKINGYKVLNDHKYVLFEEFNFLFHISSLINTALVKSSTVFVSGWFFTTFLNFYLQYINYSDIIQVEAKQQNNFRDVFATINQQ